MDIFAFNPKLYPNQSKEQISNIFYTLNCIKLKILIKTSRSITLSKLLGSVSILCNQIYTISTKLEKILNLFFLLI